MEKSKLQIEHTFYLYGTAPSGAEVYTTCTQLDGCVQVQIRDGERQLTAHLPGYFAVNTAGFSDEECAAYRAYLAEHERPTCHFALDRYFESSESAVFSLDAESIQYISSGCQQFGDAPQRYFARLLLWWLQQQEGIEDVAQALCSVPVRIEVKRNGKGQWEATALKDTRILGYEKGQILGKPHPAARILCAGRSVP